MTNNMDEKWSISAKALQESSYDTQSFDDSENASDYEATHEIVRALKRQGTLSYVDAISRDNYS